MPSGSRNLSRLPHPAAVSYASRLRLRAGSPRRSERTTVGLYRKFVIPRLIDLAMRNRQLGPYRERVMGAASGRVLEIGVGSGLNFARYSPGVRELLALEPDARLLGMARAKQATSALPVRFLEASAEHIPLEDASVDTVVSTWTMCTIPDVRRALEVMRRILKPDGRLLFVEHGLAPEPGVRKWQNRLDPLWTRLSGGCHLNRPIENLVADAGFDINRLQKGTYRAPSS